MRACKKSVLYEPIWPRFAPLALLAMFGPVRHFFAPFGPVWPCLATLQFSSQGTLSNGFAKVITLQNIGKTYEIWIPPLPFMCEHNQGSFGIMPELPWRSHHFYSGFAKLNFNFSIINFELLVKFSNNLQSPSQSENLYCLYQTCKKKFRLGTKFLPNKFPYKFFGKILWISKFSPSPTTS